MSKIKIETDMKAGSGSGLHAQKKAAAGAAKQAVAAPQEKVPVWGMQPTRGPTAPQQGTTKTNLHAKRYSIMADSGSNACRSVGTTTTGGCYQPVGTGSIITTLAGARILAIAISAGAAASGRFALLHRVCAAAGGALAGVDALAIFQHLAAGALATTTVAIHRADGVRLVAGGHAASEAGGVDLATRASGRFAQAVGGAPVAREGVAVVALLVALLDAVAAHGIGGAREGITQLAAAGPG